MTDISAPRPSITPATPFVSTAFHEPQPAPVATRGPILWARQHLFGSVPQVLLTLFGIWLLYVTVPPLINSSSSMRCGPARTAMPASPRSSGGRWAPAGPSSGPSSTS